MIENRTIFTADNLDILPGMDSESVDLIYLDPPFNSNRTYAAPIGSKAAGAAFKDTWTLSDTDDAWWGLIADEHPSLYKVIDAAGEVGGRGDKAYLIYMAMRLLEMKRILKSTGSIYYHCDSTMSHSVKLVMDSIFGYKNFKNEIIWRRTGAHNDPNRFGRNADNILFFTKSNNYIFNPVYTDYEPEYIKKFFNHQDEHGKYQRVVLTGSGVSSGESNVEWKGYRPSQSQRHWSVPRRIVNRLVGEEQASKMSITERLDLLDKNNYIYISRNGIPRFKQYLHEMSGAPVQMIWGDIPPISAHAKERLGYPTQKPLALLERIVKASSNEGDVVFDPFCGCATTLIAAEKEKRQWIGIDISLKAVDLVKIRLHQTFQIGEGSEGELDYKSADIIHRTDIPIRSDHATPPSKDIKHILFGKQKGICNGCKHDFPFQNFTLDHIQPTSRGGADTDANLQLLCNHCNSVKSNGTMAELIARLRESGILH